MAQRITRKDLEQLCTVINNSQGTATTPYTKNDDGTYTSNPDCYHLSGAYGGWALHQGGSDVLRSGHVPARELYYRLNAFVNGITAERLRAVAQREG